MKCLRVDNLSLELGGSLILSGISATLNRGEMVGLIGPNGAGKSSLLRSILGLVKINNGSIIVDDTDINALSLKQRARKMAYAAQGAPVYWPLTVEHIIGLGRMPHLNPWQKIRPSDRDIINDAMIKTDCTHLKGRSVMTLSGGERARVLLARVLATKAPYVMADEPVAALDPAHQLGVMNILKELASSDCGVLVVMHDLSLAARYCDRIILLNEGKMIGQDKPDIMLNDDNLADVFSVRASRWKDQGEDFIITRQIETGI